MPAPSNTRKVVCPECDQVDVVITRDDEGDDNGTCQNCGLNVGRVLTKNRYDKALTKLKAEEEKSQKKAAKKTGFWS